MRSWVAPARRRRLDRRGISEVIGTILLLAMTIIMFGTVFLFTSQNQGSVTQAPNEFTSSLAYSTTTPSLVTTVSITHLSGNVLTGGTTGQVAIYVVSQKHPGTIPSPATIPAGLGGSTTWGFGQTWTYSIGAYGITAPDNLTISVVAAGQLQYRSTLLAIVAANAPTLTLIAGTPAPVAHGGAFTLSAYATFSSSVGNTVTVNETEIAGLVAVPMVGSGGSGTYTLAGVAPATPGTYYLFLTATGSNSLKTNAAYALVVT